MMNFFGVITWLLDFGNRDDRLSSLRIVEMFAYQRKRCIGPWKSPMLYIGPGTLRLYTAVDERKSIMAYQVCIIFYFKLSALFFTES